MYLCLENPRTSHCKFWSGGRERQTYEHSEGVPVFHPVPEGQPGEFTDRAGYEGGGGGDEEDSLGTDRPGHMDGPRQTVHEEGGHWGQQDLADDCQKICIFFSEERPLGLGYLLTFAGWVAREQVVARPGTGSCFSVLLDNAQREPWRENNPHPRGVVHGPGYGR